MAQWSRADRTLYTKLVYYGPAFGGKTTNLQALHRITDPQRLQQLVQVKTADDRTLFFDLLPFDLGDILGYQVAMKLYTVPGQVRYDTTRQVVLSGADAVVFVADSAPDARERNVWSLNELYRNMRLRKLDPARVPVLIQLNKQDLPGAVAPDALAGALGLDPGQPRFPSVAIEGRGVLEIFMAACHTMLQRLVAVADDRTRREIEADELDRQIDRAFAPYLTRAAAGAGQAAGWADAVATGPIVLESDPLLESAVEANVRLGERLVGESARAARLEREAEAFRRLSEALRDVGATFDRRRIIDASLGAIAEVLRVPVVTLLRRAGSGGLAVERIRGSENDPLLDSDEGCPLLDRMRGLGGPCVSMQLPPGCEVFGVASVAAVPVEPIEDRVLVAYAAEPDGPFDREGVRFLATVAGHLAAGLEKSRLHEELTRQRDGLEEIVAERTRQLREALDELRGLDQMKDRFLGNLSHEMRTPLTAVLTATHALREYPSSEAERKELLQTIVGSAECLQQYLDHLLRLVQLESGSQPLRLAESPPEQLLEEAVRLAGQPQLRWEIEGPVGLLKVDQGLLARCLANLIDNAIKFSPPGAAVELRLRAAGPVALDGTPACVVLTVLDRGCGVAPADRERIFSLFEQGGEHLSGKPHGIGVGLFEASRIARRHGGTLEHFPREDGGSEFRLTIPLEAAGQPAEGEPAHV